MYDYCGSERGQLNTIYQSPPVGESSLRQRVESLPTKPGVYLFKDVAGNILYVGKSTSLRHRVSSYFGSSHTLSPKLWRMMARVGDFEFFLTHSEQEAILLECNLIKKYRPRYNVRLKDDKSYPYLKVSLGEEWPRIYVTRQLVKDNSRYFGPFTDVKSVRQMLNLLRKIFPFRTCKKTLKVPESRPCLDYHLHRCLAPCIGAVSQEEYRQMIGQVILFLEGKQEVVIQELQRNMEMAAERLEFEKAALLRDEIETAKKMCEHQKITAPEGDLDIVAMAQSSNQAYMMVFFVRSGKLMGRENFILEGTQDEEPSQIMSTFITQFYSAASYIPHLILLQHLIEDTVVIRKWLSEKRGGVVTVQVPHRGLKKELVDMVAENACQGLEHLRLKTLSDPDTIATALEELQQALMLPRSPQRIECYDVSNIQGTSATGSMVVFKEGQPLRSHYRRFRIRTVSGANDYAMLQEVLERRFRRSEGTWVVLPDLVLIDGGKGQLSSALEVMQHLGINSIPVASIAKEREEIFLPQRTEPVVLPSDSVALHLLQQARDEAHRFAIGYFRRLHTKTALSSILDSVPGIGPKHKRALLKKFGSERAIKEAKLEEISVVEGITYSLAKRVKLYL